jgi:hypothetical protein
MNINWNFTSVKSDFSEPLQLIQQYVKICLDNTGIQAHKLEVIITNGLSILLKFNGSSNLDQSILALEIMSTLIHQMDSSQKLAFSELVEIPSE